MRENSRNMTQRVQIKRFHRYSTGSRPSQPPLPSVISTSPSRWYITITNCKKATRWTPSLAMHRQYGDWKSSAFQQSFETYSIRRIIWKPAIAASVHWPTAIIFALANWWFLPSIPSKQELPSQKRDGSFLLLISEVLHLYTVFYDYLFQLQIIQLNHHSSVYHFPISASYS